MNILVVDKTTEYLCEFVKQPDGSHRLWVVDTNDKHYPTFSRYCPHENVMYGECTDCSMVIESD
jgi:hypothetical protein